MTLAAASPLALMCFAEPMRVIDLTKPAPPNRQSARVPGGRGGSVPEPKFDLPLAIKVESAIVEGDYVYFEVTVRNIGREPYALPIGRDSGVVHKDGNRDRRTFLCLLVLRPEMPSRDWKVIGSTVSSSSVPNSYVVLKSQGAVSIKMRTLRKSFIPSDGVLDEGTHRLHEGKHVQVNCKEWKIDDNAFMITRESNPVGSNSIAVTRPVERQ